ncbi:squalene/phytoene synthase family protein [Saxibacter everestensis]|uniref:Squalene/phytoene synthase family protein n=1 Tax=Saxibacter everestensis TaxID=2909229 RepID=A0ABY8QRP0_9MICO|nr:squalene/phytoene synthase family protein [Brevibacteriaceae bacterium ZFBP1038]
MSPRLRPSGTPSDLALYSRVAQRSSAPIIRNYSTSFGMAARLLDRRIRPDIENIYGLVRVADEIVDGAAHEAGLDPSAQRELLDAFENETVRALRDGFSTNLVVHAFALTARTAGISPDLTAPFFASMRRDLSPADLTEDELRDYIYGSAEVVGLMCLRVFLKEEAPDLARRQRLEFGASRLGAAFQKINFLRDLPADWNQLGRNYLPGMNATTITEREKRALVADIDADLKAAAAVIPELPRGSRAAVTAAHSLFSELSERLRMTPARDLMRPSRTRVPNALKLRILVRAAASRALCRTP